MYLYYTIITLDKRWNDYIKSFTVNSRIYGLKITA